MDNLITQDNQINRLKIEYNQSNVIKERKGRNTLAKKSMLMIKRTLSLCAEKMIRLLTKIASIAKYMRSKYLKKKKYITFDQEVKNVMRKIPQDMRHVCGSMLSTRVPTLPLHYDNFITNLNNFINFLQVLSHNQSHMSDNVNIALHPMRNILPCNLNFDSAESYCDILMAKRFSNSLVMGITNESVCCLVETQPKNVSGKYSVQITRQFYEYIKNLKMHLSVRLRRNDAASVCLSGILINSFCRSLRDHNGENLVKKVCPQNVHKLFKLLILHAKKCYKISEKRNFESSNLRGGRMIDDVVLCSSQCQNADDTFYMTQNMDQNVCKYFGNDLRISAMDLNMLQCNIDVKTKNLTTNSAAMFEDVEVESEFEGTEQNLALSSNLKIDCHKTDIFQNKEIAWLQNYNKRISEKGTPGLNALNFSNLSNNTHNKGNVSKIFIKFDGNIFQLKSIINRIELNNAFGEEPKFVQQLPTVLSHISKWNKILNSFSNEGDTNKASVFVKSQNFLNCVRSQNKVKNVSSQNCGAEMNDRTEKNTDVAVAPAKCSYFPEFRYSRCSKDNSVNNTAVSFANHDKLNRQNGEYKTISEISVKHVHFAVLQNSLSTENILNVEMPYQNKDGLQEKIKEDIEASAECTYFPALKNTPNLQENPEKDITISMHKRGKLDDKNEENAHVIETINCTNFKAFKHAFSLQQSFENYVTMSMPNRDKLNDQNEARSDVVQTVNCTDFQVLQNTFNVQGNFRNSMITSIQNQHELNKGNADITKTVKYLDFQPLQNTPKLQEQFDYGLTMSIQNRNELDYQDEHSADVTETFNCTNYQALQNTCNLQGNFENNMPVSIQSQEELINQNGENADIIEAVNCTHNTDFQPFQNHVNPEMNLKDDIPASKRNREELNNQGGGICDKGVSARQFPPVLKNPLILQNDYLTPMEKQNGKVNEGNEGNINHTGVSVKCIYSSEFQNSFNLQNSSEISAIMTGRNLDEFYGQNEEIMNDTEASVKCMDFSVFRNPFNLQKNSENNITASREKDDKPYGQNETEAAVKRMKFSIFPDSSSPEKSFKNEAAMTGQKCDELYGPNRESVDTTKTSVKRVAFSKFSSITDPLSPQKSFKNDITITTQTSGELYGRNGKRGNAAEASSKSETFAVFSNSYSLQKNHENEIRMASPSFELNNQNGESADVTSKCTIFPAFQNYSCSDKYLENDVEISSENRYSELTSHDVEVLYATGASTECAYLPVSQYDLPSQKSFENGFMMSNHKENEKLNDSCGVYIKTQSDLQIQSPKDLLTTNTYACPRLKKDQVKRVFDIQNPRYRLPDSISSFNYTDMDFKEKSSNNLKRNISVYNYRYVNGKLMIDKMIQATPQRKAKLDAIYRLQNSKVRR